MCVRVHVRVRVCVSLGHGQFQPSSGLYTLLGTYTRLRHVQHRPAAQYHFVPIWLCLTSGLAGIQAKSSSLESSLSDVETQLTEVKAALTIKV